MVPNTFAVLGGLGCGLRCGVAAWLIFAISHRRAQLVTGGVENRHAWLLSTLLVVALWGLNLASGSILFGYLQCLAGELRGAMCLIGAARIGEGADGFFGAMPGIVTVLAILKPFQAFAGGGVLAVLQAERCSRSTKLRWILPDALYVFAVLVFFEAILESVYLIVPKVELGVNSGCCLVATGNMQGAISSIRDSHAYGWICSAFFLAANSSLACLLLAPFVLALDPWFLRCCRRGAILLLALGAVPLTYVFVLDVLVPRVVKSGYHRCIFDLWNHAPESLLGLVLVFFAGCFVVWEAVFVVAVGDGLLGAEAKLLSSRIQFLAGIAYVSAVSLSVMELVVA